MYASNSGQTASKSCHTCRRSRLLCDRAYPHCMRCASRRTECLGYGTLLRWTGAVASRGKLAGQPSSAALYHDQAAAEEPHAARDGYHGSQSWPLTTSSPPWSLADSWFKDSSYTHRRYYDYFSSRVCLDLIAHDFTDHNPFRNLLPLATVYPVLHHVIIAASAAHMCNQARNSDLSVPFPTSDVPDSTTDIDALMAKQKALQVMPCALQNIDVIGSDILLAATLFLVNVELIESGNRCWKPHLEGAARIMSLIQPLPTLNVALNEYIVSDCVIYCILSLTLNPLPSHCGLHSYLESCKIVPILEQAVNSYFCCPPEVLDVLLLTSRLYGDRFERIISNEDAAAISATLLERVRNVDPLSWANKVPDPCAFMSRLLASSAHRLAAFLYVKQYGPAQLEQGYDDEVQAAIADLYDILQQIPDEDPNFKATAWPTFVIGTTATTRERQDWVVDRMKRISVMFPWGFVNTAMSTLELLWGLDDGERSSDGWVYTLRELGKSFLMV